MTASSDPRWPSARSLLGAPAAGRRLVGLTGISTYHTSVTTRSWHATPTAVREALERFSTWSYSDQVDIAERVAVDDRGDVFDPDAEGGTERAAGHRGSDGAVTSPCYAAPPVRVPSARRRGCPAAGARAAPRR